MGRLCVSSVHKAGIAQGRPPFVCAGVCSRARAPAPRAFAPAATCTSENCFGSRRTFCRPSFLSVVPCHLATSCHHSRLAARVCPALFFGADDVGPVVRQTSPPPPPTQLPCFRCTTTGPPILGGAAQTCFFGVEDICPPDVAAAKAQLCVDLKRLRRRREDEAPPAPPRLLLRRAVKTERTQRYSFSSRFFFFVFLSGCCSVPSGRSPFLCIRGSAETRACGAKTVRREGATTAPCSASGTTRPTPSGRFVWCC